MGGAGGAGSAGPGSVVGRVAELAVVGGLAGRAAAGVGGVLLVAGEQGIGKSVLLRAGLSGAGEAGCRVAWGTADELDQVFPLRFMARCLVEAAAGLPGARDGLLGGVSSDALVRAGVERVLAVVDRLCAVSPVVLVAEDLQWADEASLEVWRRLSQAAVQLPLLLAGSFRPVPSGGELEGLRREVAAAGGMVIELGPLPAGEVAELAAGVLGARPGRRLAEVAGRAGGNPLYVRELLDALVRDGRVAVDGGVAELAADPGGVPQSLAAAIADRLGVLPGEMLPVLRCAAVLGQEFPLADLALVAGLPTAEVRRLAGLAAAAGVLAGEGEGHELVEGVVGFRHGLIRQAVYEGIPLAVRGALHFQAARALAGAGAPAERVAAQLTAAPGGDEWEAGWLAGAAPDLVYRAPGVAAGLLRRALGRLPPLDPRREALEMSLLTAAALLLDGQEAERVARSLLARTADPDRAAEVSWLLITMLFQTGRAAEYMAAAEQALARPGISGAWAARFRSRIAVDRIQGGRMEEGEAAARQALAVAERAGDWFAVGYALHVLSAAAHARHDVAAALAYVERGVESLRDEPRGTDQWLPMMANRASMLAGVDRFEEAGAVIREAMAVAERIGTHRLGLICSSAAEIHFDAGQWDDALTMVETATATLTTSAAVHVMVRLHGVAALVAAHRDDWTAARRHLAAVQDADFADPQQRPVMCNLLLARALAAERAGDLAEAVRALAVCLDPEVAAAMGPGFDLLPRLARLAAAAGDTVTVRAAAAAAQEDAAVEGLPVMVAAAGVCQGLAEGDPGPLLAAAAYFESAGRPFYRAMALEEAAVLLAGRGEMEEARRAFAGAVAGYQALGAAFDLRRADTRMRELGVRRRYGGRREAPVQGWQALTGTERVVAGLAAQGRSNPDIAAELLLSRSTVQTHVSHILAKLGARSRAEIARHAPHA